MKKNSCAYLCNITSKNCNNIYQGKSFAYEYVKFELIATYKYLRKKWKNFQ